jgi:Leucine-rich repeat (LRR) protein
MSIQLQFYNLIIPKELISKKYSGGYKNFSKNYPNNTFQEDNELVSFSFMNQDDVDWFCSELAQNGLDYSNNRSNDFVVTEFVFGNLWDVDWLERDSHHCWYKGVLPTHTNNFSPTFKEHKILNENIADCVWWNKLTDSWKNILFQNYIINGPEKVKRLHSLFSFGYNLKYIGEISEEDILKILALEEIWVNAILSKDLGDLEDLSVLNNFKKLKSLTLRNTCLKHLEGIEKLCELEYIEIGGTFSDIENLRNLKKLKTLNLHSKEIKTIKPLFCQLDLTWMNINNGRIQNKNEFDEYKQINPLCSIYKSLDY